MMRRHDLLRIAAVGVAGALLGLIGCESTGGDGYNDRLGGPVRQSDITFHRGMGLESGGQIRPRPQPVAEPAPAPRPVVRGACDSYFPAVGSDMSVVGLAFPTGDTASSALVVHQVLPREVRRGADFNYEYHVTNITQGTLQNVVVQLESQENLTVSSSSPAAQSGGGFNTWALGDLGACETRVITVTARAQNVGVAANCVSATYNNTLCATLNVVDPALAVTKMATPAALLCDTVELKYEVCNTGSGIATGVVIRDTLPAGLTTTDGATSVELPVGTLAAGECATRTVYAKAQQTGEFASPASAMADGGLTANSERPSTVITQPVLEIACEAGPTQIVGRNAVYTFNVRNTGSGEAANTVVNVAYPAYAQFVSGSAPGGSVGAGSASFNLGTLPPNGTASVTVTLGSSQAGNLNVSATASADCADAKTTECVTNFRGVPAILLECVDDPDPVVVGDTTTYTISVTNQGFAPDTNVRVVCTLPEGLEFVSGSGSTAVTANGNQITFGVEATLEPKEKVEWKILVRATGEGDVRFAVSLTSKEFPRSIDETESTNLYR